MLESQCIDEFKPIHESYMDDTIAMSLRFKLALKVTEHRSTREGRASDGVLTRTIYSRRNASFPAEEETFSKLSFPSDDSVTLPTVSCADLSLLAEIIKFFLLSPVFGETIAASLPNGEGRLALHVVF